MKRSELFFAFLQVPIDAAMIILAFVFAYYARVDLGSIGFYSTGINEYLKYALYVMPFWIIIFAANGLYSIKNTSSFSPSIWKVAMANSTAIFLFVMLIFFTKTLFFSRLILIFIWIISVVTIVTGRLILTMIQKSLLKTGLGTRKVMLIGNNLASQEINKELSKPLTGLEVVGVVGESNGDDTGLKMIGDIDNLKALIKKYSVDEVILTESKISKSKMAEIIETCSDSKACFKYVPDIFALVSANFKTGLIGSLPVMELRSIPLDGWGRIIKRIVDSVIALLVLIVLSPFFFVVAVFQKLTSRGPIFYSQIRVGRDENPFKFYKFRTMYIESCDFSKKGTKWTTKDDEKNRVTPMGRFLRKTNLDELPQLWNILKGDMSLVGPRPELPGFVQKFEQEIPEYFRRHKVKSGLTGWAQANGLKGDTSIKDRVRYDIYYIENWSLWFDFIIILKTLRLVINEALYGKSEYRSRS